MPALPLPNKSVSLSPTGFAKLYGSVRKDPAAAKRLAEDIEADPRAVLQHAFKLTKAQQKAIENATDADLRKRARVLLAELRSAAPSLLRFDPNGSEYKAPPKEVALSCTCVIHLAE